MKRHLFSKFVASLLVVTLAFSSCQLADLFHLPFRAFAEDNLEYLDLSDTLSVSYQAAYAAIISQIVYDKESMTLRLPDGVILENLWSGAALNVALDGSLKIEEAYVDGGLLTVTGPGTLSIGNLETAQGLDCSDCELEINELFAHSGSPVSFTNVKLRPRDFHSGVICAVGMLSFAFCTAEQILLDCYDPEFEGQITISDSSFTCRDENQSALRNGHSSFIFTDELLTAKNSFFDFRTNITSDMALLFCEDLDAYNCTFELHEADAKVWTESMGSPMPLYLTSLKLDECILNMTGGCGPVNIEGQLTASNSVIQSNHGLLVEGMRLPSHVSNSKIILNSIDQPALFPCSDIYFDNCQLELTTTDETAAAIAAYMPCTVYLNQCTTNVSSPTHGVFMEEGALSITGGTTRIQGKYGIHVAMPSSFIGGDTLILAEEAAITSNSRYRDVLSFGENTLAEPGIVYETQWSSRYLQTISEAEPAWEERGYNPNAGESTLLVPTGAVKQLHITGNGAFDAMQSVSPSNITVGAMLQCRTSFSGEASLLTMIIALPSQLELLENSVTVNSQAVDYTFENNVLSVTTSDAQGTLAFAALVVAEGNFQLAADVRYLY